jgi:hypothetical protein
MSIKTRDFTKRWFCGNGHAFAFGNEDWHFDDPQGFLNDGSPIPRYCTEEDGKYGEPCMDSSSLIWETL